MDSGAANYIYDAESQRLRKDAAGSPSTEYVYFGDQIIAEKNVNVSLQASMLTQSGLTAFVPGAIGDGNVASQGWHTDSASPGAWLQVDLGSARNITGVGIYAASAGYAGTYNVQYSDDAASWSQAGSITPSAGGWNAAGWSSLGAHRYWRLYLANTPGPGPWLTELQLQGNAPWTNYIFFDGRRVARQDFSSNAVSYYFSDHLKTADVITDAAGNIKSESDYYPWGGELPFLANDSNHYKFTGKERDKETQLDYFGARYYSNGLGRFVSADWSATPMPVPYADFGDPQSLNLYSYVRNLPTTRTDADGHDLLGDLVGVMPVTGPLAIASAKALFYGGIAILQREFTPSLPAPSSLPHLPGMPPARNCTCPGTENQNNQNGSKQNDNNSYRSNEQGRDAEGKFLPKNAGESAPGSAAEKEVLDAVGATKNTQAIPGSSRIPDGTIKNAAGAVKQYVEGKSGASVSNTAQLRQMAKAAMKATGKPLKLVTTNPNVKIADTVMRNKNIEVVQLNAQK